MKNRLSSASPAQITGIILLSVAAVVFFFHPLLAAGIAFFYVFLCIVASFFPQSSFYLPVISRGNTGKNLVALTFDDGPSPLTLEILDVLDKHSVKVTFFVSGENALKYPQIIKAIINRGHTIGNHSFHHNPFLMLGSYNYLYQEIFRAQEVLNEMEINTLVFRPPVGIISPKLPSVLNTLKMYCVTFSCRAFDAGNRRVNHLSAGILKKVKADDIILLHDVAPPEKKNEGVLISEIEKILQGLAAEDLKVVPLATLIGKEIIPLRS